MMKMIGSEFFAWLEERGIVPPGLGLKRIEIQADADGPVEVRIEFLAAAQPSEAREAASGADEPGAGPTLAQSAVELGRDCARFQSGMERLIHSLRP